MLGTLFIACASLTSITETGAPPVRVVIDMDAETPGIQSSITVPACTASVQGISVYIIDPLEERAIWSIGYLGGLDRGISLGHRPSPPDAPASAGRVVDLLPSLGAPVNPGGTGWMVIPPGVDPGFDGPEIQYVEYGATAPAVIPATPAQPVFTVTVILESTQPGDRFEFFLLDFVSVWTENTGGAFSTQGPLVTLDTGGDSVPDGTDTIHGIDPDGAVPVPPAAFLVDYIDGPPSGGGASIEIVAAPGDFDGNGAVEFAELLFLLSEWGTCPPGAPCPADLDASGAVDFADLLLLLANWGTCPPPG